VIEKGFFFPTDYSFPTSAINTVDGDKVYLNVTKDDALNQGWDQPLGDTTVGDDDTLLDGDSLATSGAAGTADGTIATSTATVSDAETLRVPVHEEELTATTRPVERGQVRIDKEVIAEERTLDVPITEERVTVFYATDNGTKDDGRPVKGGDVLGRPIGYVVSPEDRLPIKTSWTGMTDYVNAPPDYGTFFRQYLSYTRFLVSKFGVPSSDLEDVVSDIMTRFLERDSIGVFSNDWASRSATGKSNFRSYYSRFVVTYAQGMNRNVRRHASRNVLICDAPVDDDNRTTCEDEHAPTESFEDTTVQSMDFESLVASLRAQVDPKLSETVDAKKREKK